MKSLSRILKSLEKRKIITKKPHPIIPFILGFVVIGLIKIAMVTQANNNILITLLYILAIFTFIFAILHWVVVIVLKKK